MKGWRARKGFWCARVMEWSACRCACACVCAVVSCLRLPHICRLTGSSAALHIKCARALSQFALAAVRFSTSINVSTYRLFPSNCPPRLHIPVPCSPTAPMSPSARTGRMDIYDGTGWANDTLSQAVHHHAAALYTTHRGDCALYVAGGLTNIYRNSPRIEIMNTTVRGCTDPAFKNCSYGMKPSIAIRDVILSSIH